ncbi:hypothetical protein N7488_011843 [Penicillium malachiteum]|nr:hypothetical protein N7488_011843 [Penicillium malachiteum]
MSAESSSWSSVQRFLEKSDIQTVDYFRRTKWDELCRTASGLAEDLECLALDQVASGLNNIVRVLQFSDQTRWAARVHIRRNCSSFDSGIKLEAEVGTLQFIKQHSDLRVPRIFAYETDENNLMGVAFMLMELLPSSVAIDANSGYELYRSIMYAYLQNVQVGAVLVLGSGPIPGIGGPFDIAAEFFKVWADTVKFRWDIERITQSMQGAPISAEQMITIIENFPSQIKAMASQILLYSEGPFPLNYDDFLYSNIMVDENSFDGTGIIDWEAACTVPWELIAFPAFLSAMPASFDLPDKYDRNGYPLDEDLRETWREREGYIEMVKSAELQDHLLSDCLGSKRSQAINYAYGAYTRIGKNGVL